MLVRASRFSTFCSGMGTAELVMRWLGLALQRVGLRDHGFECVSASVPSLVI
jgi:hypothetical protein